MAHEGYIVGPSNAYVVMIDCQTHSERKPLHLKASSYSTLDIKSFEVSILYMQNQFINNSISFSREPNERMN